MCSYGLIAHFTGRKYASSAAMKAVLVNKVGDYCLFLVLIGCLSLCGSAS